MSVFGWGDYIDPSVIEEFTKETGIKVTYDSYQSAGALERRIEAGKTDFDVVIVPGDSLRKEVPAGLFQKIDKSKLQNVKNLSPEVMARLDAYDRGSDYALNYMWFTAGIAYNSAKLNEVLGDSSSLAAAARGSARALSWGALFRLDNLKKFANCGVTVLDSGREMFALALIYLKGDPGIGRWSDFMNAADLLKVVRRHVKKFDSSSYADALLSGEICLAVGYSAPVLRAQARAREAGEDADVGFAVPKEGSLIASDNLAILKGAPDPAEAYEFIDFLLRPEIAARNARYTGLSSGVLAPARAEGNGAGSSQTSPGDVTLQRLFAIPAYGPQLQRIIEQDWFRNKSGK